MAWVYVIQNAEGRFYIGMTTDLEQRLQDHNSGISKWTKYLRKQSPHTAVIIITGRDETNLRTRALEGGAFAFLVKPFDDEEFLDAVRGALGEPN
jgi:DNA-binding response OmpR family regulator